MARTEIFTIGLEAEQFLQVADKIQLEIDDILVKQKLLGGRTKENGKEFIALSTRLKANRAELGKVKKSIIALDSPYKKLSNQLNRTRDKAKDLAVAFGEDSRQARRAAREVLKLDTRLKKIDKSVGQSQREVGKYSNAIKGISARFIGWGLAIGGAIRVLGNLFRRIRTFDKAMVGLSAILGISRSDLKELEATIKEVAGSSIKTSNEVAELATALATLGKSKEQIILLLKPVNDLAIGLQATSEEAGQLLIKTLNAFGESGREAGRYADIIAKMRTSTALDFEQIKDSLGFLAPVAKVAGLSFEETGAILGTLVDSGIKAARAGRITASSFLRLAKDGKTLNDALDEINEAQARNITETELLALATELFGVQGGALGIILADNRDKTAELTKEFENSSGALEELTETQLESLDAKIKILDSTWEKFILNLENGEGVISRNIIQFLEGLTLVINALDNLNKSNDEAFDVAKAEAYRQELSNIEKFVGFSKNTQKEIAAQRLENFTKNIDDLRQEVADRKINIEKLIEETTWLERKAGISKDAKTLKTLKLETIELQKQIGIQDALADVLTDTRGGALNKQGEADEAALKLLEETEKERQARIKKFQQQQLLDLEKFIKDKIKVENALALQNVEGQNARNKLKVTQKLESDIRELDALKIADEEKLKLKILLEEKAANTLAELEEQRVLKFDEKKTELENRIAEGKAITDEEKAILKTEQDFEKHTAELVRLELEEFEKTELLKLLIEDRDLQLKAIQDKFILDAQKLQADVNKKELEAEREQSKSRADIANTLTSVLVGALGDSLGAKLAGIAIQGAVEAGLIGITTASAQARNLAQATASAPPPLNIPLIATALAQNTVMGANSAAAIAKVIASSALQGAGTVFEEGGMLSGPSHKRGGIHIEVEGGEAIINKRSMADPYLRDLASQINQVGGGIAFEHGGALARSSINSLIQQGTASLEEINDLVDRKINKIQVINNASETAEVAKDAQLVRNFADL